MLILCMRFLKLAEQCRLKELEAEAPAHLDLADFISGFLSAHSSSGPVKPFITSHQIPGTEYECHWADSTLPTIPAFRPAGRAGPIRPQAALSREKAGSSRSSPPLTPSASLGRWGKASLGDTEFGASSGLAWGC